MADGSVPGSAGWFGFWWTAGWRKSLAFHHYDLPQGPRIRAVLCVFGAGCSCGRRVDWRVILLAVLIVCFVRGAAGQNAAPQKIADGARGF